MTSGTEQEQSHIQVVLSQSRAGLAGWRVGAWCLLLVGERGAGGGLWCLSGVEVHLDWGVCCAALEQGWGAGWLAAECDAEMSRVRGVCGCCGVVGCVLIVGCFEDHGGGRWGVCGGVC